MYIHDVIPVQKGIPFDILSYYWGTPLLPGTLVHIKIGSATRLGLVSGNRPLLHEKTAVRNAAFTLKKIEGVLYEDSNLEKLITALTAVGKKTLAPFGSIFSTCVSEKYLEQLVKVSQKKEPNTKQKKNSGKKPVSLCTGETKVRYGIFKEHIREYFALGRSVVVVVPTILDAETLCGILSKGIEKRTFCLHGKKKVREFADSITKMNTMKDPVLLVATPAFSFLLREDTGLYLIEKEASELYESNDRFRIDTRLFLSEIAKATESDILYADVLPRFEHFTIKDRERFPDLNVTAKVELIIPTMEKKSSLPKEVVELLQFAKQKNRTLFFYSHRRGLAPLSRCKDCGTVVGCPTCEMPLVLKKDKKNEQGVPLFICNGCSYTTSSHYTCRTCLSWNIVALEIGTDSIIAEIKKIMGSDTRIETLEDCYKNLTLEERDKKTLPGTIYVGTEHFFPYIPQVDYVIMPFFDRLLSTPSYETTEKALRVILQAQEWSAKRALIFSKTEHSLFTHLFKGTLERFITEELTLRKQFHFPPFGVFVRITLTAPAGAIEHAIVACAAVFTDALLTPISLGTRRTLASSNTISKSWILLVSESWFEEDGPQILQKLLMVRPSITIERNPHYFN